jgi:hypothetical protein
MRLPFWAEAFLDGFTLGGLLSTGRPSAATSIFPEKGYEEEALVQFMHRHKSSPTAHELFKQLFSRNPRRKGRNTPSIR